jgi:imidazolonepropionase-like amidohydrolase
MYRCLLVAFFAGLALAGRCQLKLGDFAFVDVTLVDANHPQPLAHQTVVIRNGKIAQVFTYGTQQLPDSVDVIAARGKWLIPGLIDTHVHLATDPSGVDNRAATLLVLEKMLYSGITTVRDMAGDARVLSGLSRDALVGDIVSPDIHYSALMAGPEFFVDPRTVVSTRGGVPGKMPYMQAVSASTDVVLAVAEAKGTGASGIKLYANIPAGLVTAIVAEAKRQGMLVWGHAWLNPAKPDDLILAGVGSISHAPLLFKQSRDSVPSAWKHGHHDARFWDDSVHADANMFVLMKEHHTILDATLSAYEQWARQDSNMAWDYEITKRMAAAAYKAGVTICAGTDDDQEAFVQHELHLLVHDAGMSNFDALVAGTRNAAMALGMEAQTGTVEKGKTADLVLLSKNPLDDIDNVGAVTLVVKAGTIYNKGR